MFVRVGDVRLFFDVEGSKLALDGPAMREKPTLLCLHGGPGLDHSMFRPAFAALTDVAQVIYLDLRGHGRSDRSCPERWSLAQWAADTRAFCEALGIESPVLLGTSFGGYVGLAYGVYYPDALSKLILISTSPRGTGNADRRANVLRAFTRRGGTAAQDAVRRAFDERTPDSYEAYGKICGPLYNHASVDPEAMARTIRSFEVLPYFERVGGEGAMFDLTARLDAIQCRTLIIAGDDDPITPIEEQQSILDCIRPGLAELRRFPRCGHGVLRDDRDGFLAAVRAFICSPG